MTATDSCETAAQKVLRAAILGVHANNDYSESEKARRVQELLLGVSKGSHSNHIYSGIESSTDESSISYHDQAQKIPGCPHYQLKARILAPCCNKWVVCRFCHDESSDHSMDRHAVESMKCMLCSETQPIAQNCIKCSQKLGHYYCNKCKLLDDDGSKKIFHCDKCGICLSGCNDDYYHCDTCDACVAVGARNKHGCKEKRLHCDCPICGEQFFDSIHSIVQAECLHLMHEPCLQKYIQYSYKCPVCAASLCDTQPIFTAIDNYMRISCMPIEYRKTQALIFCNDCHKRSVAKFHFVYHKCQDCSSYNTSLLSTFKGMCDA